MANVTIVSPFRDCGDGIAAYRQRVDALDYPPGALRFVVVEGDSVDDTAEQLAAWAERDERVTFVQCDTGKPHYGSVVHPERFEVLATVFNAGLDAVDLVWSDFALFLPSDILYAPDLVGRLVGHGVDLVSPLTWTDSLHYRRFYDLWAVSQNDRFFGPFPYAERERLFGTELTEMTTIGGTMLISADVLRAGIRYTPEQVDRGLCYAARAAGFRCWLDATVDVEHS